MQTVIKQAVATNKGIKVRKKLNIKKGITLTMRDLNRFFDLEEKKDKLFYYGAILTVVGLGGTCMLVEVITNFLMR
jgi:hypothetical protein